VEVTTETGDALRVDRAIVAVPPFVLPTIGFDPPLSEAKLAAVSSLQRAFGGKITAQYAEGDLIRGALTRGCFSDGPVNTAWVSNPYVKTGPAVVSGFVCGTQRAALESDEAALAALDSLVETAVGEQVTRIAHVRKDWTPDRFTLSITVTPGYAQRGDIVALAAVPERRVHFAGDYTDIPLCGTMEGAVRSGQRAADEVLRRPRRMSIAEIDSELVRS
jgi:monoamine oxidase